MSSLPSRRLLSVDRSLSSYRMQPLWAWELELIRYVVLHALCCWNKLVQCGGDQPKRLYAVHTRLLELSGTANWHCVRCGNDNN